MMVDVAEMLRRRLRNNKLLQPWLVALRCIRTAVLCFHCHVYGLTAASTLRTLQFCEQQHNHGTLQWSITMPQLSEFGVTGVLDDASCVAVPEECQY